MIPLAVTAMNSGLMRKAVVFLMAGRHHVRILRKGNIALPRNGHGAINTAAAFLTTLFRIPINPLNVIMTGSGPPITSAAKGRPIIQTHLSPNPPVMLVGSVTIVAVRRANSGIMRRTSVFIEAGRLRIRALHQRNNVLPKIGRGATNTAAAFLTTLLPVTTLPLSALMIGNGRRTITAARNPTLIPSPLAFGRSVQQTCRNPLNFVL